MISLKLTELEGGYFVPELNGHPVYLMIFTFILKNLPKRVSPQLPPCIGGGCCDHMLRAIELKLGMQT